MGKFLKGILGPFTGKVGTVVGSTWKGIAVMRSVPGPRKGKASQKQLEQQVRFALMMRFLQPISDLLNQNFDRLAVGMSGVNKAISYNVLNAITGNYPDFAIDYTMLLVGRGDLPNATAVAAASAAAGKLSFTWTDNSGLGKARPEDKVFVAAFCEALKTWTYVSGPANRNAGTYTLDVTGFSGHPAHTYLGFISDNGKFVTNSIYAGAVNVL